MPLFRYVDVTLRISPPLLAIIDRRLELVFSLTCHIINAVDPK